MKFIFADSLDYIDPTYDFVADRNLPGRKPYWDDLYPHEFMDDPPYHGVLVSRAIIGDGPVGGGKYTPSQAQRFRREGARAFLRLGALRFNHMPIFGDCGAFAYHREDVPPYSPEGMVTFYDDAGFTHGCSVDHIIFEFDERLASGLAGGSPEARRRFDITLANAESFLAASRRLSNSFTPLGVVQGWSPGSMAEAARRLCKMGYRYLAVGGTVTLRTAQIKACLRAVRDAIPPDVDLHVLGFAKADDLAELRSFRITSFDTTSPLLRAFKDNKSNYYLRRADGRLDYYTAIRVPQAIENTKLLRLAKRGAWRQEDLLALERRALSALRAYDREETGLEEALDAVMAYGTRRCSGMRRTLRRPRRSRSCVRATDGRCVTVPGRHAPVPSAAKPRSRSYYSAPATVISAAASTTWASLRRSLMICQIWSPATPMEHLTFLAVRARQSPSNVVLSFAARVADVLHFAAIERVARDAEGRLSGFQRPQIAAHIREIRDYLAGPEAVLPNPTVVAFTSGVAVEPIGDGLYRVAIDLSNGPPGLVVDGQQRLSALGQIEDADFEVFISALVCRDDAELRRQFVLINNTRPLPKTLIYELLPTVEGGLPKRLSDRTVAADLTARLNHDPASSLRGQINQHTNPDGVLSDIAVQKVILNSLSDGALRQLAGGQQALDRCSRLLSDFYQAVQYVFADAWTDHTPRTSRLVHGAGIVAMGYVLEELHRRGAETCDDFRRGLGSLVGRTAWTAGEWDFGDGDRRHWKAIQNTSRDIVTLAQHLVGIVRADARARLALETEETPLLKLARV